MTQIIEKARLSWWNRAYNKIWNASTYNDSVTFATSDEESTKRLVSFIYNNIKPLKGWVVLDVGCGNGVLGKRIFRDCNILVQTDYSFGAVKLIKDKSNTIKRYMLQSNAGNLPFKEGVLDCIFAYSILHYSGSGENAKRWIRGMLSLLKSEGRLYLGDVPMRKKIYKELMRRATKVRSINHIKYYFAEFMQNSFSANEFLEIEDIAEVRLIPQPKYLRFNSWRIDIEITKKPAERDE